MTNEQFYNCIKESLEFIGIQNYERENKESSTSFNFVYNSKKSTSFVDVSGEDNDLFSVNVFINLPGSEALNEIIDMIVDVINQQIKIFKAYLTKDKELVISGDFFVIGSEEEVKQILGKYLGILLMIVIDQAMSVVEDILKTIFSSSNNLDD